MDYVLAKVSRKEHLFKLISDKSLYEGVMFNNDLYISYDPDHNLDEESWFKIEGFSQQEFYLQWLKEDFDPKVAELLEKKYFSNIKYIVSVQQEGNIYCFQKITPSIFLKKKFISFNEHFCIKEDAAILIINELPEAIYFKDNDILIFKNLPTISSIFKGIDSLYKEATDDNVKNFLSAEFVKTTNDFNVVKVSKPNRKRIAMAMDSLERFTSEDKVKIFEYIKEYCPETLEYDQNAGSFEISTDGQLKILLYGIEQRFYTTPINNEKRLANSIIKL